ncbi:MAG: HlyD family efflux transporter periplasmic adaptor subunit [Pirellulaceae bacterium]
MLTSEASDSDEFYRQFVAAFADVSSAEMGLAWTSDSVPFQPTYQFLRDKEPDALHPLSADQHAGLLTQVRDRNKAILATPPANSPSGTPALLVGPLRFGTELRLLEFVLPGGRSRDENESTLNQFNDACRLVESIEPADASNDLDAKKTAEINKRQLDEFSLAIHQSLDPSETANTVANEVRRILGSDRVSVFYRHGNRFRCTAISGQPSVNRRSNTVVAVTKLVNMVSRTGREFWFPTDNAIPPQIDAPLSDYVAISMSRSLAVVPIAKRGPTAAPNPIDETKIPKIIACLVIEQVARQWNQTDVESSIQTVCRHSGEAIRNAQQVQSIFLYPVWKAIGQTRAVTLGRHLPRTLLIAAALLGLVLAMIFVKADFLLTCDGTLEPVRRQRIFSDQDAIVRSVGVQHGTLVSVGDPLLTMENNELEIRIAQLTGEIDALRTRLQGSRSMRIRGADDSQPVNQKELESQINSLELRLRTVQTKKDQLQVTAPIDGEVLTWDLAARLSDRPVRQGELLLEIADPKGDWRLQLDLPDRKYGHIIGAKNQHGDDLAATFSLASAPGKTFVGRVAAIDQATSVNSEHLHVVRLWVDVDETALAELKHAGASVQAKIDCGKRSLGFVWLHEIWEFVQYKVLFHVW